MRSIAYIAAWEINRDGVSKKIRSQLEALGKFGETSLVSLHYPDFLEHLKPRKVFMNLYNQTFFQWHAIRASAASEIIYYRYAPQNIAFNCYIALMSRGKTLIVENNTNNISEFRAGGRRISGMLNRLFEPRVYRRADAVVAFTRELAAYVRELAGPSTRVVMLTNGYDENWVQTGTPERLANWEARLLSFKGARKLAVFVGHPAAWHGIDKILTIGQNNPDWALVMIGPHIRERYGHLLDSGSAERFLFLDELDTADLSCVYRFCDLALGSFAMERKGMSEAASLKVREYVFYDLPVVIGHYDAISEICEGVRVVNPDDLSLSLTEMYRSLPIGITEKQALTWRAQIERLMHEMEVATL